MPRLLSFFLSCTLLLSACAAHKQHQKPSHTTLGTTKTRDTMEEVSVIEFDSNGTFWDRKQLEITLQRIHNTPKPLLITFIHGWRHNARPDDADLQQFGAFIKKLRNSEKPLAGEFTPIGLYIGWRGATINEHPKSLSWLTVVPAIFSFWNVKSGTDRVALRGDLGYALNLASAAAWKGEGDKDTRGKSVMIGHSFGGRILEMVSANQASVQTKNFDQFRPMADLVILINPASESLNARQTKLRLKDWNKPYPLFIAVGAKNDKPNKNTWPLGFLLGNQPPMRVYEDENGKVNEKQKSYLNTTVANDPRQFTHTLEDLKPAASRNPPLMHDKESDFISLSIRMALLPIANLEGPKPGEKNDKRTIGIHLPGREKELHPFRLKPVDTKNAGDVNGLSSSKAYWVFQVPTSVLSGHSGNRKDGSGGVLNTAMMDLVGALLSSSELSDNREISAEQLAPKSGE